MFVKSLHVFILFLSLSLVSLTGCEFLGIPIGNSILVVDLSAVAKATGRQELMQKELEFAILKLNEQLKLVAAQLEESITDEKDKFGKSPSAAQTQQLEQLVVQAQKQLINTKNLAVQQSTNFRSDLIFRFHNEVGKIAQEVAHRTGSKLVLVSNYETIWFDPSTDITDEVIAIMRARNMASIGSKDEVASGALETKDVDNK